MNSTDIHFSRPSLGQAEEEAVARVLRSGWIVSGPCVEAFEQAFAHRCGAAYGIAVSSWTTGAFLVLKSWNIGPGDEVIVPSLTFIATVNAIRHIGATPVFAEVDPRTWNISPGDVVRCVTPRTRVILAVDQLGLPCELAKLANIAARWGIRLLDDAACAFGSAVGDEPVGSLGDAAVFSLHARKVITTGEGGMILTNDQGLRDTLKRLRHQGMSLSDYARHGKSPTTFETYPEVGYNFRMTDIQAAIGMEQLKRADALLARRTALAARYNAAFAESLIAPPFVPRGVTPNWQSYQVAVHPHARLARNEIMDALFRRGIHTRRGVMASHLEPSYARRAMSLPITEQAAAHTLQLPLFPDLTDGEQDRVIAAMHDLSAVSPPDVAREA